MKRPKEGSKFMNPKTGVIHVVKDVYQSLRYCRTWCACYFGVDYSEYCMREWTQQSDGAEVTCKNCLRRLGLSTDEPNKPAVKRWLIGLAVRQQEESARLDTDFRLASSFCRYRHLGTTGRGKWWGCKKVETPSMRGCCIKQCPYFNIK